MEARSKIETQKGNFYLRRICPEDNPFIRDIIVNTLLEFGASGDGFACNDQETSQMFEFYQQAQHVYYVIVNEQNEVLGGGGVAPLKGATETCEFVKMYFLKEIRGLGIGKILLNRCIEDARDMGYRQVYLETLEKMETARALYEKNGFMHISAPMGSTGHYSCDAFYLRRL